MLIPNLSSRLPAASKRSEEPLFHCRQHTVATHLRQAGCSGKTVEGFSNVCGRRM